MNRIPPNKLGKISDQVKKLSKGCGIKVSKKIINETEIWCLNHEITQQFFDVICYLGTLNLYSKNDDIIYDIENSLPYIDIDLPDDIESLHGLSLLFELLSSNKDIFDFEALSFYSNSTRGENYIQNIKQRPHINLEDIIDYEEYHAKILAGLKSSVKAQEPSSNLRCNGLFLDSDNRLQITDELYRILLESVVNNDGKLNAMISYLDFRTRFPGLLIEAVALMVLSGKEVRILFRSENTKEHVGMRIFRKKVENKLKEIYFGKKSVDEEEYDEYVPVNIDSPRFFREWNSEKNTPFGNKLMLDINGNLHAKIFMNHRKGIVSSANLMMTSLTENIEVGVKVVNQELEDLQIFFDTAWRCVYG